MLKPMTHSPASLVSPTSSDAAGVAHEQEFNNSPDAALLRESDAPGMHESDPLRTAQDPDVPDPSDEVLVDQAGRALGPRALQTRRKILDATVQLLSEKPMRNMRVIDIARQIGSSPATFYQYFKDVEDVVLHLAGQMKEATPQLVELIAGDWDGRAGHERGRKIAHLVIDHWEKYAPVLRARNNASDEGNMLLREERMSAMLPLVEAFTQAIARAHEKEGDVAEPDATSEWSGGRVDPLVGGTALSSCVERLAMYHGWISELGGSREDLVETMATLMQSMLTSRR
jgi:AcrR family transcriptional regulator